MNFTDSPFERMMKQKPYVPHKDRYPEARDAKQPSGGRRGGDNSQRRTSGQVDPKLKP